MMKNYIIYLFSTIFLLSMPSLIYSEDDFMDDDANCTTYGNCKKNNTFF